MLCWLSSVWLFIATLLTKVHVYFLACKISPELCKCGFIGIRVESLKSDERNFLIICLCKPVLWHKCEMLSCHVLVQVARLWKNVSWDPWSLLNGHSVVLDRAQWKGNSHGTQEHILYEGSCHVTNSVFCLEACLVWIRGERNRKMENKSERDIETQTEREERKRLLLIRLIKLLPSELSRFTFHNMAGSSIDLLLRGADSKESSSRLHTVLQLLSEDTCPLSLINSGGK